MQEWGGSPRTGIIDGASIGVARSPASIRQGGSILTSNRAEFQHAPRACVTTTPGGRWLVRWSGSPRTLREPILNRR